MQNEYNSSLKSINFLPFQNFGISIVEVYWIYKKILMYMTISVQALFEWGNTNYLLVKDIKKYKVDWLSNRPDSEWK